MTKRKHEQQGVTLQPVVSELQEKSVMPDEDWHAMLMAYRKKYEPSFKKEGKKKKDVRERLSFPSREEAILFFKDQAFKGRMFLMAEYVDGKATGFHVYSCGDGELYQGTLSAIRQQLRDALEESAPDIDKKTKAGFDDITRILSSHPSKVVSEDEPGSSEEKPTAPTPFKKRPRI